MGEGDRIRTLCIFASQGLSQRHVSWREVKPMRGSERGTEGEKKNVRCERSASNFNQTFCKNSSHLDHVATYVVSAEPCCSHHTLSD